MSMITIGPARIGDAPGIANMSRLLIEAGLPWRWTPRRVAAHMRQPESLVVVARKQRDLAGFVMAQFGDEAVHITLLGVALGYRRLGLGGRLIAWVEESATAAGLFKIGLEVRAGNQSALRFYAALGYSECGVVARYYSGVESAVSLTRDLQVKSDLPQ